MHGLGDDLGTAVIVQMMVFGNRREGSATGVAFTRDPTNAERRVYGEYLENAQGEDVVAGVRTPAPLTEADAKNRHSALPSMEVRMPEVFSALTGTLWLLQTRRAKCSAKAAMRIAVEMAEDGLISRDDALLRFAPTDIDRMLHPMVDPKAPREVVARGLPASTGAVTGEVCFTAGEAETLSAKGRSAILVRIETSPEDIHGMYAAAGVLTVRGGMTSHAAVVARGLGTPCVCGAGDARIDLDEGVLRFARRCCHDRTGTGASLHGPDDMGGCAAADARSCQRRYGFGSGGCFAARGRGDWTCADGTRVLSTGASCASAADDPRRIA